MYTQGVVGMYRLRVRSRVSQCPGSHNSSQTLREGQAGREEGCAIGSETREKGRVGGGGSHEGAGTAEACVAARVSTLYIIILAPGKGQTDVRYSGSSPALTPRS